MSIPAFSWASTMSATAVAMRRPSAAPSTGMPSSLANMIFTRSAARGRLPVCVVRKRSLLRFTRETSPQPLPASLCYRAAKRKGKMAYSRCLLAAAALVALAGCALTHKPTGDGPQWIERPAQDLIDANGKPDRVVRLPSPSLSSVLLYLGGAEPGFAICERDYFVR